MQGHWKTVVVAVVEQVDLDATADFALEFAERRDEVVLADSVYLAVLCVVGLSITVFCTFCSK